MRETGVKDNFESLAGDNRVDGSCAYIFIHPLPLGHGTVLLPWAGAIVFQLIPLLLRLILIQ